MNCQNCEAPVLASDVRCEKCGAKLLHRRIFPSAPRHEDFVLTVEEPSVDFEEEQDDKDWPFPTRAQVIATAQAEQLKDESERNERRWGGFFRRLVAGLIDVVVITLLCGLMAVAAYVGYKVGLTAHNRSISWNSAVPLVAFLTFAGIALSSVYFVVFHGMEGKTVGKWLLGLRVVGAEQLPITYRRALLRWIATVGFGLASLGLSILWILWQSEKRGWHDYLARTWVIRG